MATDNSPVRKKTAFVATALLAGMLVPYISRIPGAFVHGTAWIWSYMSTSGDVLRWNGLHVISLIPIVIFGLIYIFGSQKWGFVMSVVAHLAATSFLYAHQGDPPGKDDFLGCIVFPPMLAVFAGAFGFVAFAVELFVQNRRSKITNVAT
jgi:hypothetical protein